MSGWVVGEPIVPINEVLESRTRLGRETAHVLAAPKPSSNLRLEKLAETENLRHEGCTHQFRSKAPCLVDRQVSLGQHRPTCKWNYVKALEARRTPQKVRLEQFRFQPGRHLSRPPDFCATPSNARSVAAPA